LLRRSPIGSFWHPGRGSGQGGSGGIERYAIANPLREAVLGYPPAMLALDVSPGERAALVQWIKSLK
jgi:hypothetical protein